MRKRILLVVMTLFLFGGGVGAVAFQDAMDEGTYGGEGLFPSWEKKNETGLERVLPRVGGIVGAKNDGEGGGEKLLMNYLPRMIDILLKFVAPFVLVSMIYAGVRFVYAGSNEEELSQAKEIFTYTLMGAVFVVLSYSIMKALYFILST